MVSVDPRDLSVATNKLWLAFDELMKAAGIPYVVTCTHRSEAEQEVLFDQGRRTPGKIVTNAPPGMSAHNCVDTNGKPSSEAFDIVVLANGKPDWDGTHPVWEQAGKLGESVGLEWAGRWRSFPEKPHFQKPNWKESHGT